MKTGASNIATNLKRHMQVSKWLTAIALFSVPLQTQWLISAPIVNGSPWEFGVTRVFVSVVLCLVAAGVLFWRGSMTKEQQVGLGLIGVLLGVWSFGGHGLSIHAFTMWLQISMVVCIPVLMWQGAVQFGLRWVLGAALLGVGVTVPFGLWQVIAQTSPEFGLLGMSALDPSIAGVSVIQVGAERLLRAYGTLPHPNVYGGLLVIAMLAVWKARRGVPQMLWALPVLAGMTVVTFSRSAWLALIVAVLFLAKPLWKQARKQVLASAAVVVILAGVFWPQMHVRFGGEAGHTLEARSIAERVDTYEDAQGVVASHLIFGTGIGAYTHSLREVDPARNGYSLQPAHNVAVLVLAELGLVGVMLLLMLLLSRVEFIKLRQVEIATLLATLFVLGTFDHYLWSTQSGVLILGIGIGLITCYHQNIQT